jgi:HlyD family secretion protein
MTPARRRFAYVLFAAALAALGWYLLRPVPVDVETATASVGPLQVTVDEEGETRARDRYIVSAPVSGRVARIAWREGDAVSTGQVVATIAPRPLGSRERAEQVARLAAAEALRQQADDMLRHARADHEQAARDSARARELSAKGLMSPQAAEQAANAETTSRNQLDAAQHKAEAAAADVRLAKAGLMNHDENGSDEPFEVRSPVSGKVLRVLEKSERVVEAGTPLLVLGDPTRLEVVVDLLSNDAVKVRPGMPALLENWGGDHALRARVRVVEPYAFTKISALGIEEQRVNVVLDFVDPPGPLGDGYRVDVRIITWQQDKVLRVPSSAVFRYQSGFAVFVVDHDRVRRTAVRIGHRGEFDVEIAGGIKSGQRVVVHPPNDLDDGTRVRMVGQ